nr:MobF family relaxase [uncultured Pseudogulbenkiania sp.]
MAITIGKPSKASNHHLMDYYLDEQKKEKDAQAHSYYTGEHPETSQWLGAGANALGLQGEVKAEDYKALYYGFEPGTLKEGIDVKKERQVISLIAKNEHPNFDDFSKSKQQKIKSAIRKDFTNHIQQNIKDKSFEAKLNAICKVKNAEQTNRKIKQAIIASLEIEDKKEAKALALTLNNSVVFEKKFNEIMSSDKAEDLRQKLGEIIGEDLSSMPKHQVHSLITSQLSKQRLEPADYIKSMTTITGKELVKGAGDEHRTGFDITLSPPKSVSVEFAHLMKLYDETNDEKYIQKAQQIDKALERANAKAMAYVEKITLTRLGAGGKEKQNVSGLIISTFAHDESRALDPQKHFHNFVHNVALCEDGTYRTIENHQWFNQQQLIHNVFKSELAIELRKLDFAVENQFNETKETFDDFEIKGFSKEELRYFSKRTEAIEQYCQENGISEIALKKLVTLKTRASKEGLSREELYQHWAEDMKLSGFDYSKERFEKLQSFVQEESKLDLAVLREDLTKNNSYFREHELTSKVLAYGMGHVALEEAQAITQGQLSSLVCLDDRLKLYTTPERLELEARFIALVESTKGNTRFNLGEDVIRDQLDKFEKAKGFKLNETQVQSILHATTSQLSVIEGSAGAGKSTCALVIRQSYEAKGFNVIGCAPSGKAASGLQEDAGIQSSTIDSLLINLKNGKQKLNSKTVIVMDEAGMVDMLKYSQVLEHVSKAGAKLISVGDFQQLQAVNAGAPHRLVGDLLGRFQLDAIQRQKDERDRTAALDFANGNSKEAWAHYMSKGCLSQHDTTKQAIENLSKDYIATLDAKLTESGHWTTDADTTACQRGDQLIYKDQLAKFIKREENGKAVIETQDGKMLRVSDKSIERALFNDKAKDYAGAVLSQQAMAGTNAEVMEANLQIRKALQERGHVSKEEIFANNGENKFFLAQGDKIVFTQNNRKMNYMNGEQGLVIGIDKKQGLVRIQKTNGKILQLKTNDIDVDLAFCVSVHKAQGITSNQTLVYMSPNMSQRQWTYVAMSRHKYEVKVYTSDIYNQKLLDEYQKKVDDINVKLADKPSELRKEIDKLEKETKFQALVEITSKGIDKKNAIEMLQDTTMKEQLIEKQSELLKQQQQTRKQTLSR